MEVHWCRWQCAVHLQGVPFQPHSESATSGRDGATGEWIPIVIGVPQGSVLDLPLFILYTSEMFELVENRLYAYAVDSILLALFSSQQTDLILLPPCLGYDSGVVQSLVYDTES